MAHVDREQTNLARRNLLKGAAALPVLALPAVALARPMAANPVPLEGTDEEYIAAAKHLLATMPEEDHALAAVGRDWLSAYRRMEQLCIDYTAAEMRYDAVDFVTPEALMWRDTDRALGLEQYRYGYRDAELNKFWYPPSHIARIEETLQRYTSRQGEVSKPVLDRIARYREIVRVDAEYRARKQAVRDEVGLTAAEHVYREVIAEVRGAEHEIEDVVAQTFTGLQFKALTAIRYIGTLEDLSRHSQPTGNAELDQIAAPFEHRPLDMVTHNLVAMALGNVSLLDREARWDGDPSGLFLDQALAEHGNNCAA